MPDEEEERGTTMTDSLHAPKGRVEWERYIPYFVLHASCLFVLWTGASAVAIYVGLALYLARMFLITGFYHRYFSHRTFKTSRLAQFIFGLLGCTAGQRGPVWWASHHCHHHRYSDKYEDTHSPHHERFWISHFGWFMRAENTEIRRSYVKDWLRYPELIWLEENTFPIFISFGISLFALGELLGRFLPQTGTNGAQMCVWGFVISTVAVYHATYAINDLAHLWGTRRFETDDLSRNNALLALLTLGEGWHNNHHWYPASARQGLRWWEIDITYYVLKLMSALGIIWDLRTYPKVEQPSTEQTG